MGAPNPANADPQAPGWTVQKGWFADAPGPAGDAPAGAGPEDHGFLEWTYDAALAVNANIVVSGTINTARIRVRSNRTITKLVLYVSTLGSGLTAGQSIVALYDNNRNLVGQTADQASAFASTGLKTPSLVTPKDIVAGSYLVAFWSNGTTPPNFARAAGTAVVNGNLATAASRFATANTTGITTTPPPTLAVLAAATNGWWAAMA